MDGAISLLWVLEKYLRRLIFYPKLLSAPKTDVAAHYNESFLKLPPGAVLHINSCTLSEVGAQDRLGITAS